jgi:hypothetical protein
VAEEEAVGRKEARRVRPLLSEPQVPEWQGLAVDSGLAEVEGDVEEHRYSSVPQAAQ